MLGLQPTRQYIPVLLVFLCLFTLGLQASAFKRIQVVGNDYLGCGAIFSITSVCNTPSHGGASVEHVLSQLAQTGLFYDTHVFLRENSLVVVVKENLVVNRVAIRRDTVLTDDLTSLMLNLRTGQIYTAGKLKEDIQCIKDFYRSHGYPFVIVKSRIKRSERNSVNVFLVVSSRRSPIIRSIQFLGNRQFSDSKLEEVMKIWSSRWYRFLPGYLVYNPNKVSKSQEALHQFYLENGYADFQVGSTLAELTPDQKDIVLTFTLHEGDRYRIGEVEVTSQALRISPETVRKLVSYTRGNWYSRQGLKRMMKTLTKSLENLEQLPIEVQPFVSKSEATKELKVSFLVRVNKNSRVYADQINIAGNEHTDESILRRALCFHEGDLFNLGKLQKFEKVMTELGLFKNIKVTQGPSRIPGRARIKIGVEESKTGELQFGTGFSNVEGLLAHIQLAEHNLHGQGRDLRVSITQAKHQQEFDVGFTEPSFLSKDLTAKVGVYRRVSQKFQSQAFSEDQYGAEASCTYKLTGSLIQTIGYRLSFHELQRVVSNTSRLIREQDGRSIKSCLTHDTVYDTRDSRIRPTKGVVIRLTNEIAGLGGTIKYLRNSLRTEYYYPFSKSWVLALEAHFGFLNDFGKKTQMSDRFILGGNSLRGFEVGGVSPRDRMTLEPLGGHRFYKASAELGFPVSRSRTHGVTGLLFIDAGNTWLSKERGPEVSESKKLRLSVGCGLRWRSDVGPISVDLAKAVSKDNLDRTQDVSFGFKKIL